jgi:MFS family permease
MNHPASATPATSAPSRSDMILFIASFLTLIAAGIGFSVRGGILGDWSRQFGFTQSELGTITGGGLVGFGVTIIFFSFLADRVGYRALMVIAFLFHLSSAVVTLLATPVFESAGKEATYWCLYIGMFLFALGNGTCEAVINPLTATLFPRNKTHWLNILHAGWPAGLILGAVFGLLLQGTRWEVQMSIFLIPTLLYGILMLGRPFPKSETTASGVTMGTMLLQFLSPILLLLVLLHAMVGYVELGTDSWISNITGTILSSSSLGLALFIWTSFLMFALRFCAGPIVHQISPLGLLFVSAVLGATGLYLLGTATTAIACFVAATIYGLGKTFFWPTMLGVVSERYPKGGALALGIVGGVGMLSAGALGGPGIGYKQDYYATGVLQAKSEYAATYERYKASNAQTFLFFPPVAGLDGAKVGVLLDDGKKLKEDIDILQRSGRQLQDDKELARLAEWWYTVGEPHKAEDLEPIKQARLIGGQEALKTTALVPVTMALGYLLLIVVFMLQGGYRQIHIGETEHGGTDLPATPQ